MGLATTRVPQSGLNDRRGSVRYPVNGDAAYRLVSGGETIRCRVVDLSTTGLMLECGALQPDVQLEVLIPWSAAPESGPGLKLHVVGRTVRVTGSRTAVQIEQSDFRFDG